MDWIDPRYAVATQQQPKKSDKSKKRSKEKLPSNSTADGGKRRRSMKSQAKAALSQPLSVWSAGYHHALGGVRWPSGVSLEATLLFSAVIQEQAEVLVRAGMPAGKLAAIVADPHEDDAVRRSGVVGLMDGPLEAYAFDWLEAAGEEADAALGTIGLAWHVPEHAERANNDWLTQWMQTLLDRMHQFTVGNADCALCDLVLGCELPLLVSIAASISRPAAQQEASRAMDNLAELLESGADDPSGWLAYGATYLRASLASVLRARVLADALQLRKWYPAQQKALAELLRHAARCSRSDGTHLLGAGATAPKARSAWHYLASLTRRPKSMLASMSLSGLGNEMKRAVAKQVPPAKMPPLSYYSEYASYTSMISSWEQRGGRVAIDFSDANICLDASGPKGAGLLSGEWTASVELDGQSQLPEGEWQEICWFSDEDVEYLELETTFGPSAKVQRQIVLFREDRFLFLADALITDQPGRWLLRSEIPLANGVVYDAAPKNTEGWLVTDQGDRCLAIPLFMPEWRRQPSPGSFDALEDRIVVQLKCEETARLYAPVVISLTNRHAKKPYTWRRLTVGEELRIVGADEACAERLQIGKEQWLFYRSLAPAQRRTALGMHTLADFYAGRFDHEDGDVETLVEVEPNE